MLRRLDARHLQRYSVTLVNHLEQFVCSTRLENILHVVSYSNPKNNESTWPKLQLTKSHVLVLVTLLWCCHQEVNICTKIVIEVDWIIRLLTTCAPERKIVAKALKRLLE